MQTLFGKQKSNVWEVTIPTITFENIKRNGSSKCDQKNIKIWEKALHISLKTACPFDLVIPLTDNNWTHIQMCTDTWLFLTALSVTFKT